MTLTLTRRVRHATIRDGDPADRPCMPGAALPPNAHSIRLAASEHRDRASVAAAVGASPRQLRNWQQRHPEVANALLLGDADRLARDFHLCWSVGSYGAF